MAGIEMCITVLCDKHVYWYLNHKVVPLFIEQSDK